MLTTRSLCVVLLATMASGGSWASAAPVSPVTGGGHTKAMNVDNLELNRRLDRLDAKLQRLETSVAERRLSDRRRVEIRALVADLLADADTRASLLSAGLTAGYDDGFFLAGADGNFRLEVSGQIQQRYVANQQRNAPSDNTRGGFELRRAKLKIKGYILGPDLAYSVTTANKSKTGTFALEDTTIRIRLNKEMLFTIGRARPPLLREESISSKRQLAVERSLIARTFGQSRSLGVSLKYRDDALQVNTGIMDASDGLFADQRWRVSTRVVLLLKGEWKGLEAFASFPDDEPTIALGAGILYQNEDRIDPTDEDSKLIRWTADVAVESGGANVFAAVVGNHFDEENQPTLNQLGVVLQGGVFVTVDWELFAQYVWGDADGEAADLSAITFGVNRYFDRHDLKWTVDVGYGVNEVGSFWSSSGAGWRTDTAGEDGQVVLRAQLQMLF